MNIIKKLILFMNYKKELHNQVLNYLTTGRRLCQNLNNTECLYFIQIGAKTWSFLTQVTFPLDFSIRRLYNSIKKIKTIKFLHFLKFFIKIKLKYIKHF